MMPKKKLFTTDITGEIQIEQERILVGCIRPALKPYMFQFQFAVTRCYFWEWVSPPDVTRRGWVSPSDIFLANGFCM